VRLPLVRLPLVRLPLVRLPLVRLPLAFGALIVHYNQSRTGNR